MFICLFNTYCKILTTGLSRLSKRIQGILLKIIRYDQIMIVEEDLLEKMFNLY